MTDHSTDQPNEDVVAIDQPHDHGDHGLTGQATNHRWATLEDAAAALDITVNAVRQRLKRGTLAGIKTDSGWLVDLIAIDHQPTTDRPSMSRATNQQPTIDLAPLVDHIASLEDQVQRLTEATTVWQLRARQAEEKLLELTAGPVATVAQPDTSPDAPGSSQLNVEEPSRLVAWWRQLWES